MIQIEVTREDAEVLRDAALIIGGGKSKHTRTLKRLWEISSGLRDIVRRVEEAIEE